MALGSRFWSEGVDALTPYVPGEQPKVTNLIKLNTNENPYGTSPKVLEAIRAATGDSLRLYPDPTSLRLREAIAAFNGLTPDQVFAGNGSDEILAVAFQALFRHGGRPVLFPDITYSFYPVYCGLYGLPYQRIPLDGDFQIRAADYGLPNAGIIFPNPNAPTGRWLELDTLEALLAAHPDTPVVVDEAYVDFGCPTAVPLLDRHPNLLVVQTLSKARSLAGLRLGFALGHPDLIEALVRVKDSFNSYPVDRLAEAGAMAAMADRDHYERTRRAIMASRERLSADLSGLGFQVLPSMANFLFARHPERDALALAAALRERAIIVRHFRQPRIDSFLRITIGTDAQCEALVGALKEILGA
jgi:histidinol-phosphate aminotransferase